MSVPAYERVINEITDRIRSGDYASGSALPSIAQLAVEFDTSQTTIKSALVILRREGLVRGQQGKGTYVA